MNVLGINCGHDSGATIIKGNKIVSAINEERLTRVKSNCGFPKKAIEEVLKNSHLLISDLDVIAVEGKHIKPSINLSFNKNDSDWKKNLIVFLGIDKFLLSNNIGIIAVQLLLAIDYLIFKYKIILYFKKNKFNGEFKFYDHHHCHAATAYLTQKHDEGLAITLDASGEGVSSRVYLCDSGNMKLINTIFCFNSPAYFYAYITKILGYMPLRHEGKITGLAAFGKSTDVIKILKSIIYYDSNKNSFINKLGYHYKAIDFLIKNLSSFAKEDVAYAIQNHIEDIVTKYIADMIRKHYKTNTPINLFLAGGMFSNVKLNQKINEEIANLNSLYVFPNMGDGGLNCGAAILGLGSRLIVDNLYLGSYHQINDLTFIDKSKYEIISPENISQDVASYILDGKLVAVCRGPMEYGPRALGNRSILFSAKISNINNIVNNKLLRTEFMPFAPILRDVDFIKYMNPIKNNTSYDFMTLTCNVNDICKNNSPAVCHIDNTARPQVLKYEVNKFVYEVLSLCNDLGNEPILVNTSFNMHEEPIVNTPIEAYNSFAKADFDMLVLGDYLIKKIK